MLMVLLGRGRQFAKNREVGEDRSREDQRFGARTKRSIVEMCRERV
jgi:hypothetical protein